MRGRCGEGKHENGYYECDNFGNFSKLIHNINKLETFV